ncbi:MAG: 30S ribosomal protein S8 [Spiroplasma sp.]|nr:30S ribosomal protein S8 [Spiroplasma sp.]
MTNDPISNLLTVIRNAIKTSDKSKHRSVSVQSSKQLVKIAEILYKNGYIEKYRVNEHEPKKPTLEILLGNTAKNNILGLKRISSPGLKVYAQAKSLPSVLNGYGIAIISTSKGIMTNKQAKKLGLGGEVLAYVW